MTGLGVVGISLAFWLIVIRIPVAPQTVGLTIHWPVEDGEGEVVSVPSSDFERVLADHVGVYGIALRHPSGQKDRYMDDRDELPVAALARAGLLGSTRAISIGLRVLARRPLQDLALFDYRISLSVEHFERSAEGPKTIGTEARPLEFYLTGSSLEDLMAQHGAYLARPTGS